MISDAGFQGEITSISTAAQQLEVFSRVLKTSIVSFLTNPEDWQNTTRECAVKLKFYYKSFLSNHYIFLENGLSWTTYICIQSGDHTSARKRT